MVKGQNNQRTFQKQKRDSFVPVVDNEYDLEKNFRKINSYNRNRKNRGKSHNNITDSKENEEFYSRGNGLVETPHATSVPLRTGDYTAWEPYIRLDDKITNFDTKNNQAHTDLRRELESKIKDSVKDFNEAIEKRLLIQWYVWTIVGLVAIVGIWYMFSYVDVHPLPKKVEDIDKRLNIVEKKMGVMPSDSINSRAMKNSNVDSSYSPTNLKAK